MHLRRFSRLAGRLLAATLGSLVVAQATVPSDQSPDSARSTLAKWMETERIIAQERGEWQHSRDMLRARIDLLKSEVQTQQEKTRLLKASGAEVGSKRATLRDDDQTARTSLEIARSLVAAG